jgi:two-component system sensor histidine kinase HupT/HoxJ
MSEVPKDTASLGARSVRMTQEATQDASHQAPVLDDAMWVDVIQKMDEVYSQLVLDEIELEKKNVELEQSQQFILSVISAMSDVLLVCTEVGIIEETNSALCELVGRREEALRSTSIFDLLADESSVARARGVLSNVRPTRHGETIELNLRGKDGEVVSVDANCTPRISARKRRVGTVFVARPTAEIKRAYHELRSAHEALKVTQQQLLHSEKMASLGRLVAGVAHELNNPISFVLGNVHALRRYSERLATYLDAVHSGSGTAELAAMRSSLRIDHLLDDLPSLIQGTTEGAQRTADIVHGLKRFSATGPDDQRSVDLNQVTELAIRWLANASARRFKLHWTPGPPCLVMGSAGRLQQVVMNLLENALDAVAAIDNPEPAVWIEVASDEHGAFITVRDNGPGIADENLSRVFEPFFTTKAVGKGTGLGLSISFGIVEQHGGTLTARNVLHRGAEFTVRLPNT